MFTQHYISFSLSILFWIALVSHYIQLDCARLGPSGVWHSKEKESCYHSEQQNDATS